MRNVTDQLDLAQLQAAKRGYILNARNDRKLLHRSGCEAIGAMVSSAYPKIFFEELDEAREWSETQYGKFGWAPCGKCLGRLPEV
jgi:hypothetical protein